MLKLGNVLTERKIKKQTFSALTGLHNVRLSQIIHETVAPNRNEIKKTCIALEASEAELFARIGDK